MVHGLWFVLDRFQGDRFQVSCVRFYDLWLMVWDSGPRTPDKRLDSTFGFMNPRSVYKSNLSLSAFRPSPFSRTHSVTHTLSRRESQSGAVLAAEWVKSRGSERFVLEKNWTNLAF